jgi:pantoate kinase
LIRRAKAFAPAAISSFFEICDQTPDGKPMKDPAQIGARGGGFGLQKGTLTEAFVQEAKMRRIQVSINGQLEPRAKTTKTAVEMVLKFAEGAYDVRIEHQIEVPIGAGFGTSAGGALTSALAVKQALDLPLTVNQIGKIAHAAEISCQTGLGTVSSLAQVGGCPLVVEPGEPGICVVDRIPLMPNKYMVIAGIYKGESKKRVLTSPEKRGRINKFGKRTLQAILAEPSLENFLSCCWQFAQDAGFASTQVHQLIDLAKESGAVGAAQNMLGEAVHAVALKSDAEAVAEAFQRMLPKQNVLVSKLDFEGARLIEMTP